MTIEEIAEVTELSSEEVMQLINQDRSLILRRKREPLNKEEQPLSDIYK